MKKSIIIANWKMNLSFQEAKILAKKIIKGTKEISSSNNLEVVICPPFMSLPAVVKFFGPKKDFLFCGAQDCFWEEQGGFTGEVSPVDLKEIGCDYVILGHSERRNILKETDEMVHKKVRAALNSGLIPIICVGETRQEREKGLKEQIIINQITQALEGIRLNPHQKIILAYEPVWVIGSGQAMDPLEAEYMSKIIKQRMIDLYPLPIVNNNLCIIYGGSIDAQTAKDFLNQETIDGVLVGGASLKAEEFIKICKIV
jgi:triosephosphate isomerase (TIM)